MFIVLAAVGALYATGGLNFSILSSNTLSFDDYQSGACKLAETEFITIGCKPVGDPVVSEFNQQPGQTGSFKVETTGTVITTTSDINYFEVRNEANQFICGYKGGGDSGKVPCNNIPLQRGQSYNVKTQGCFIFCPPNTLIRYSGRPLKLVLSATQIGLLEVPIPSSSNCILQDITNSQLSTSTLNQIDSSAERSLSISQEGDARPYARGYREKAGLISYFYGTDKVPAVCDQYTKKVYGFTKATGMAGQCWAVSPGPVLFDGSAQQFCCADSVCQNVYGLGSDSKCLNNVCQAAPQGNVQCLVDADCSYGSQYIETSSGTVILREADCVNSQCTTRDTQIACNPSRAYPNDQCCVLDTFTNQYKLQACQSPLRSCDTLGADACCLATQTSYTVKTAPSGKYCCDLDNNGLGTVTDSEQACRSGPGPGTQACRQEGQSVNAALGESCCSGLDPKGGLLGVGATCEKESFNLPLDIIFAALLGLLVFVARRKHGTADAAILGMIVFILSWAALSFFLNNWLLLLLGGAVLLYFFGGAILAVALIIIAAWRKGK